MKYLLIILLSFYSIQSTAFELNKYLGLWHEIYSIPNRFQKNCFNVTAEYYLKPSGDIKVTNVCRDTNENIKKSIEGEAVVKDLSKRYLKVYFFRPFGINLFGGDYYILALEENYQWAIVGTLDYKYGWVLSRSKTLSAAQLTEIKNKIQSLGFDWEKFIKTQTN